MHIYVSESLSYIPETLTTLQIKYTLIKKVKLVHHQTQKCILSTPSPSATMLRIYYLLSSCSSVSVETWFI